MPRLRHGGTITRYASAIVVRSGLPGERAAEHLTDMYLDEVPQIHLLTKHTEEFEQVLGWFPGDVHDLPSVDGIVLLTFDPVLDVEQRLFGGRPQLVAFQYADEQHGLPFRVQLDVLDDEPE